jgi:TolB-like protein/DNA-binding winged helix-turn-helix (wHTH) protein
VNNGVKRLYEFGPFRIDSARRQLLRDGVAIALTSKAFDLLLVLVEHGGQMVSKDELIKTVWPDTIVVEANLTQQISLVRKALGAALQDHRYIVTHPGRGYSFAEPVSVVSQTSKEALRKENTSALVDIEAAGGAAPSMLEPSTTDAGHTPARDCIRFPLGNSARTGRSWRAAAVVVVVILTVAAIALAIRRAQDPKLHAVVTEAIPRRAMLAILPFQNLSNDPSQEFLSDGLTEETIADLGQLSPEQLGVIARTSAMVYKHTNKTVAEIGHELNVDYLLEGSVRRDGPTVRVTAQLIRVNDQSHLWAHHYERDFTALLALQKELGSAIARQVRVNLAPNYDNQITAKYVPKTEAYECYLQGLFYLNKRTPDAIRKSIEYFGQSTEKDPSFAIAYAGLASAHLAYTVFSPKESFPKAAAAASRALDLDDGLAEAHAALGAEKAAFEFDSHAAEVQFRRAIELNPNSAYAHFAFSLYYLTPHGESKEAISELRKVLELDPFSPLYNTILGFTYYFARQYEPSLAQYKKTLRLYPDFFVAHGQLVWLYAQLNDYPNAILEITKTRLLEGESAQKIAADELALRKAFADRGGAGFWQAIRATVEPGHFGAEDFFAPQIYARLGDIDMALDSLQRSYEQRVFFVNFIKVEPAYDSLRPDPRFANLVQRMGLQP